MTAFLLCALLVVTAPWQVPAQRAKPPTVVHDTVRVIIQPPPNVEAPSHLSSIVLGIVGAFLLGMQVWIMLRQTDAMNRQTALSVKQTELQGQQTVAMNRQTDLMDKQTALQEQQATARRDEAMGTFYRVAFDLVDEFRKANRMTGTPIPANFDTHPRQMLREAARLFAPLENAFVLAATETAYALERYFVDVEAYNQRPGGRDGADRWYAVQQAREQVGIRLDMTNLHIEDVPQVEIRQRQGIRFSTIVPDAGWSSEGNRRSNRAEGSRIELLGRRRLGRSPLAQLTTRVRAAGEREV